MWRGPRCSQTVVPKQKRPLRPRGGGFGGSEVKKAPKPLQPLQGPGWSQGEGGPQAHVVGPRWSQSEEGP